MYDGPYIHHWVVHCKEEGAKRRYKTRQGTKKESYFRLTFVWPE